MDSATQSDVRGGFIAQWLQALKHSTENPVAGWLLTARSRRQQSFPLLRRLFLPVIIALLFVGTFLYTSATNANLLTGTTVEFVCMLITVGVVPAVLVWSLTGVFQAVLEAYSLLADDSRGTASLRIDDAVSVSSMSNADIAVGAMQVIMPPLFWRSLGIALSFWWLMLMLTSMFGVDLRSESFINAWLWGIVTVMLMLLSSLLAASTLVLGCISAGLHSRGSLIPLTVALLVMLSTFAWFFIGGYFVVQDDLAVKLTRPDSIYGSLIFVALAGLLALLLRGPAGSRVSLGILWPVLGALCVWSYFKFIAGNEAMFGESTGGMLAGIVRSWGSFSMLNPLFVPSPASWGDVFLRNPATGENGFASSLELRWLVGFATQLCLLWFNAWLAWHSIGSKRLGA